MDSLKELATCSVCTELFNEDRKCPRVLTCGHTFCHSCLEMIMLQNPLCPVCKMRIQSLDVESIPHNLIAKGLISVGYQDPSNSSMEVESSNSGKLESQGFCTEHSNYKELRCMDCKYWICGICSSLKHKNIRTLLVKEAKKELKELFSNVMEKELESGSWVSDCLDSALETCEERGKMLLEKIKQNTSDITDCKSKVQKLKSFKSEDCKFRENLGLLITAAKNSSNDEEFSKAKNDFKALLVQRNVFLSQLEDFKLRKSFPANIEELKTLCNKESVHLVNSESQKTLLYGLVTMEKNRICISGRILPLNEFLFRFSGSFELPNQVFLKLSSGYGKIVFIVIETDLESETSKDFVSHCSGLCGYRNFIGNTLLNHDSAYYELDPSPSPTLGNVKVSQGSWKEGTVFGIKDFGSFHFSVELENFSGYSYPKLGVVVSGLKELKESNAREPIIVNCGLVV